jgi:hypothetical protein
MGKTRNRSSQLSRLFHARANSIQGINRTQGRRAMEHQAEKITPPTHKAEGASPALLEALSTYKVCKGGTIAVPPEKCPEEQRHLDFSAKI